MRENFLQRDIKIRDSRKIPIIGVSFTMQNPIISRNIAV